MNRRHFLKASLAAVAILPGCRPGQVPLLSHITGGMVGANSQTGHLLRNTAALPPPSARREAGVLIVGGGIAGLSARRWLTMHGIKDAVLLELDRNPGGNSAYGKSSTTAYPWGAHYLPIPNAGLTELHRFLEDCGTITGYDAQGLPVFNEYHRCHDPEERLFIKGHWQEGLVPATGIPAQEQAQIACFFARMEAFRNAVGSDGRPAFDIPLDRSSHDADYRVLDGPSFADWLDVEGFTAKPLRWYLEYCTRDDYGLTPERTSAWAGIHYFAARRGAGSGVLSSAILTWPEGNGFLMEGLCKAGHGEVLCNQLVFHVQQRETGVEVHAYNPESRATTAFQAREVIIATPQFAANRLLGSLAGSERMAAAQSFMYTPWVVGNITLDRLPQGHGMPLCWDNVLYDRESVGYVHAGHQSVGRNKDQTPLTLTWYHPLTACSAGEARHAAHEKAYDHWLRTCCDELNYAHPGVIPHIRHADFWVWGHGMIGPAPGFLNSGARAACVKPIGDRIHFAHSDLSGISIFEEAFYQGIRAAAEVMVNRARGDALG